MASKYIYGRGGCTFETPDGSLIDFRDSIVSISQSPIKTTLTNNIGRRITRVKGYRLSFSVKINNISDDDHVNIMRLMDFIRERTTNAGNDKSIRFYPRTKHSVLIYDIPHIYRRFSVLAVNNTISPSRISVDNPSAGEVFTFNFIARSLSHRIDLYSSNEFNILIDDSNKILSDDSGDTLIANK